MWLEISLWVSQGTDGSVEGKKGNMKRKHKKRNYLTFFIG
jgi:hypothetical protein